MLLSLLLFATSQHGWPFREEPVGTQMLESYARCLLDARIARGNDDRTPPVIANEVLSECRPLRERLVAALTDIYTRKPDLLAGGQTASEGAGGYVDRLSGEVEPVVAREQIERAYRRCLQRNTAQGIFPSDRQWRPAWRGALGACANEREHVRQVTMVRWHGDVAGTNRRISDIEKIEVGRRRVLETMLRTVTP